LYYVFFDTIDLGYISQIAEKYFTLVVKQLIEDYNTVKQSKSDYADANLMYEYFDKGIGKMLVFLECFAYLGRYCSCRDCCDSHKSVLASDQLTCIGTEFTKAKKAFLENFRIADPENKKPGERLTFQRMAQRVANAGKVNAEEIEIPNRYSNKSSKYLGLYVREAKRYIKTNPKGFMYIMADKTNPANSHYTKFKAGINYPRLSPCKDIP